MKIKSSPFPANLHSCLRFFFGVFMALVLTAFNAVTVQATTSALGTTALLEGPTAGSDSVVLAISPESNTWTATANDAWLHLM